MKNTEEIQAGINASYGIVEAEASTDQKNSLATLKENSTCSVWGKGGDESALAALNSLNHEQYKTWLRSVRNNPQVIELEVVGIWSLLHKENTSELTDEAISLREEYRKSYEFEPIAAVYAAKPTVVTFIKKSHPQGFYGYLTEKKITRAWPAWMKTHWQGMERIGFDRIDAAFAGTSLGRRKPPQLENYHLKLYKDEASYASAISSEGGDATWKYSILSAQKKGDQLKKSLSKSIIIVKVGDRLHFRITDLKAELVVVENQGSLLRRHATRLAKFNHNWALANLNETLDPCWEKKEAFWSDKKAKIIKNVRDLLCHSFDLYGHVCFFRKDQCIWLDNDAQKVPSYINPKPIKKDFPGVTFDSIDAVLNVDPESIYFFKGDEYIRFNWTKNRADKGYPKKIRDHWAGVTFDRIDAAIYWQNRKAYFFRGDRYIAYDMVTYRADPGYPKYLPGSYVQDWKIFD